MYRLADAPIVNLLVGDTETSFHVHKTLLCDASTFFKATFSSQFKEATKNSMKLPEDDLDTFKRFLSWLYTKKYALSACGASVLTEERYLQLAKLHVLADKLGVSTLKNGIIDRLFEMKKLPSTRSPQQSTITYVYANSARGSAFRKLLVDWYTWHIDFKWYNDLGSLDVLLDVPDFAAEVARALGGRLADPQQRSLFLGKSSNLYERVNMESDNSLRLAGEAGAK